MLFTNLPPFSQFHSYEINWSKMGRGGRWINKIHWTKQESDALLNLKRCGAMTQSQLIEGFWSGNKKGRQNIRRMVKYGAINEHKLIRHMEYDKGVFSTNELLFYTPCWETKNSNKYELSILLQKLVFAQLYLKLKQRKQIEIMPAIAPFVGSILTINEVIMVAVLKNNTNELQDALKQNTTNRMIIIVEQESYVENLKSFVQTPVQWVTESSLVYEKTKRLTQQRGHANLLV